MDSKGRGVKRFNGEKCQASFNMELSEQWVKFCGVCVSDFKSHSLISLSHTTLLIYLSESYLLQAEEQFSARNFDDAEKLYDAAILSSKTQKFVNEEALANELAGHFYLDTGRKYKSLQYFCQAEEKYREWGNVTKADELASYLRTCWWFVELRLNKNKQALYHICTIRSLSLCNYKWTLRCRVYSLTLYNTRMILSI